ncbi:MAG TPA: tail fiber protein [Pyrinomonadaceae bacterium]|jgi:microcystin-dependent protein|nr:tail fiber protein [Pyrinomonadaceae bacterium]
MSQPYVGEIRLFGGSFAPAGWAMCDGQLMPISQNDILFNLIGTTYGGDGQSTFGIPDMQGRIPVHQGKGLTIGEKSGVETVTLTTQQIPVHNHAFLGSTTLATDPNPGTLVVAQTRNYDLYTNDVGSIAMAAGAVSVVGGSQPHDNMQPYLVVTFIISLFGVFPTQT